ncbi:MAG: glycerol-3-phosphate 1-O-acyltransferase PlsY [Desulfovibrio sp.]|jgi:glycerol-3-phosphate acyltransferase PlsY|nr:glycerol-3-phosphate 1-O-acyltransferase PlsY [Desulfovibrio sp.]
MTFLLTAAVSYLLGAVPFGLLLSKTFCGIDPRDEGSRNVGATNVARLCGFKWGFLTLICDLLKGALPALVFSGSSLAYVAGLSAILGHMFTCFLNFKGGKGVATTVGVFLALAPIQLVISGLACLAVIWRSGFVSAGSLTLVSLLPVLLLFSGRFTDFCLALPVSVLVIYAHRENIRRLWRGEEKPWLKKSGDKI